MQPFYKKKRLYFLQQKQREYLFYAYAEKFFLRNLILKKVAGNLYF